MTKQRGKPLQYSWNSFEYQTAQGRLETPLCFSLWRFKTTFCYQTFKQKVTSTQNFAENVTFEQIGSHKHQSLS